MCIELKILYLLSSKKFLKIFGYIYIKSELTEDETDFDVLACAEDIDICVLLEGGVAAGVPDRGVEDDGAGLSYFPSAICLSNSSKQKCK